MKVLTLLIKTFLATSLVFAASNSFGQLNITYAISPPASGDGAYISGERVEISIDANIGLAFGVFNYPHGFYFDFPEIFDLSTVEVLQVPEGCPTGYWDWYDSIDPWGPVENIGPGFFYESSSGNFDGELDSIPGNNYGDQCSAIRQFSFEITLSDSCDLADSLDLNLMLIMTSDGTTGNWALDGPTFYFDFDENEFNYACCLAGYAGENARNVQYCENSPTCLMDFITEEQNPDSGGIWTGPDNWSSENYCALFDPFVNKEGTYKYTVETDGCLRQAFVEIEFNYLNDLEPFETCEPDIINLFDTFCAANSLPLNGTWFYPDDSDNDLSEEVVDGLLNPETTGDGVFTYFFQNENQCYSKVKVSIELNHIYFEGEETWVDLCEDQAQFCPFEMLDGNPEPGGQWVITDSEGIFISYHLSTDVCFETSSFSGDITCTYVLGGGNCPGYSTPLHINLMSSEECSDLGISFSGTYEDVIPTCETRNLEIWMYEPGTANQIATFNTLFLDGGFSILLDIPASNYDIYIKIDGFLSKAYEDIQLLDSGHELEIGTLIRGDVNNNDGINITDISILNGAFNSEYGDDNFNPTADINCDGGVNILDVSTLNPGFNLTGDHVSLLAAN